jgi:hypothetical protein
MSITIILDESLEKKTISNFDKLTLQSEINLQNPDLYFAQYEHSENIINSSDNNYRTQNNFINAFLDAYNYHKNIVIRPDDIKLQLLMIISTCVSNNPDKFRSYFTDTTEKKELKVKNNIFDADYFCKIFADLLEENIKDKEFVQHYTSQFSTINQIISTVNNITLMNTLKEYFSFTMICECGIPAVILKGTNDDWDKLFKTYDFFRKIFLDTELQNWFRHFDKVIDLFKKMQTDQKTDQKTDKYICDMWKRVISYIPECSGGDLILGGWIRLFVPYNGKNKLIGGLDRDIACMDLTKVEPEKQNYYTWQSEMKEFYLGSDWGEMLSSYITTPAKLIYDDGMGNNIDPNICNNTINGHLELEYEVEFYSGFYNPHLSDSDEICMNIGYIIREDQKIKKDKLKEFYINEGVNNNKSQLKIPRRLQNKIHEILDIFNVNFYSYYGTDPVEEARK